MAFLYCGCAWQDISLDSKSLTSKEASLESRSDFGVDFGIFSQKVFSLTHKQVKQVNILYVSSQIQNPQAQQTHSLHSLQNPPKNTTNAKKVVYYFALFDSLGVPLLSRKLENGRFTNTKFLPPNKKYDKLFLTLLEMLKAQNLKAIDLGQESCANCDNIEFIYKDIEIKEVKQSEYTNE